MVAVLRAEAGRDPYDRGLTDLVGELSTRSEEFRTRWAAHNVRFHRPGRKDLHHPVVGDLDLTYEAFELPGRPRADHARLHRRAGHADRRRAELPRQLGRHPTRRSERRARRCENGAIVRPGTPPPPPRPPAQQLVGGVARRVFESDQG